MDSAFADIFAIGSSFRLEGDERGWWRVAVVRRPWMLIAVGILRRLDQFLCVPTSENPQSQATCCGTWKNPSAYWNFRAEHQPQHPGISVLSVAQLIKTMEPSSATNHWPDLATNFSEAARSHYTECDITRGSLTELINRSCFFFFFFFSGFFSSPVFSLAVYLLEPSYGEALRPSHSSRNQRTSCKLEGKLFRRPVGLFHVRGLLDFSQE